MKNGWIRDTSPLKPHHTYTNRTHTLVHFANYLSYFTLSRKYINMTYETGTLTGKSNLPPQAQIVILNLRFSKYNPLSQLNIVLTLTTS